MNKIAIYSLIFLCNIMINAGEITTPPIAPDISNEVNTSNVNVDIPNFPQAPNVSEEVNSTEINNSDTNTDIPIFPQAPNVSEEINSTEINNSDIPTFPQVPNISEEVNSTEINNSDIPIFPQVPNISEEVNSTEINNLDIPTFPQVPNISEEVNSTEINNSDTNTDIPTFPQAPNVSEEVNSTEINNSDNNVDIPSFPQMPNISNEINSTDKSLVIPNAPNTPNISGFDNISIDINFSIPTIPYSPDYSNNVLIPETPSIPNISNNQNLIVQDYPNLPNNISSNTTNSSEAVFPTIPECIINDVNISLAPKKPEIPDNNSEIISAPILPDISNSTMIIPNNPFIPNEVNITHNYIIGTVNLPENISGSTFEITFVSFAGARNTNIIDENGFWAIEFPLLAEDKEYFIELLANQNGIITKYFIDANTLEVTLDNLTPKILNTEFGTFVPDISPILVTSSTKKIGEINLAKVEQEFSIIQGYILANTDNEFSFSAINIETGEITNFDNSDLGFSKFGFKINKYNKYFLQLNIENQEYIINYKNGTQNIEIFNKNELDFNLSGIPNFDKYIEPISDMNFSIDYLGYLNSIYNINGKVKVAKDENLTLTILNANTGKFIDEVILDSSDNYSFSTILGRDFKNKFITIYLTKDSNPTTHYIYDSLTHNFKQFKDSDFIETENGLSPNLDSFTPFKILTTPITLNLDFSSLTSYKIFGNVEIPENLEIGEVCKTELNTTKYNSECNLSMEIIGFNYVSLIFTDLDSNISTTLNLDNLDYIFEIDRPKNFNIDLELSIFQESDNEYSVQYFNIVKNIQLTDYNKSINFDIDLKSKLNSQFSIFGNLNIDDSISKVQITLFDSETLDIIGFSEHTDTYFVNLDKFADENISNNDVLMAIKVFKNGHSHEYFFDGQKLTPFENIEYIQKGEKWIIDKNSSGFIPLNDLKYSYKFDLDLVKLISDFENSLFTLSGNIKLGKTFDINSSILIELINKDNGKSVENISYIFDNNISDFYFNLKVKNSGEYLISIISDNQTLIFNPETKKLLDITLIKFQNGIPQIDGFITFNNLHRNITFDINPDEMLNSALEIYGHISDVENVTISAYDINGNLLGIDEILEDGNYSIMLPTSQISDKIYLKIHSDSETYFIGSNNILVENSSVIETENSFDLGVNIQPITLKENLSQNIAFQELFNNLDKTKYRLYGDIVGFDENLTFQIIDVINHKYFDSIYISENNFSMDLPNGGEFILYITTDSQDVFYDFNNSTFVSANNVEFVNIDNDWLPNWSKTGSILLNTENRKKEVNIDFSNLADDFITISGEIILPSEFLLGETCKIGNEIETDNNCDTTYSNYQLLSLKSAFISIIDRATNKEIAFYPIENENQSVGNNIKYNFAIDIENHNHITRDLIFNIYLQEKDLDTTKYYQLMYDFENSSVINNRISSTKSWISLSGSKTDISLDLSTFLTSQKKIILKLQTPTNFILENGNSALISLYDYETGEYLDSIKTYSDKNITFEVGTTNGKYLFEVELENSEYAKIYYFDFGISHNSENLTVLQSDDVQWIEKNGNIIPDIHYLELSKTEVFLATIPNSSGLDFSGSVNSDIEMKTIDIMLNDFNKNISYFANVENGTFKFHNIKEGNYSISLLTTDLQDNFFQVFVTDSGFINNFDLIWKQNLRENNSTFYYPANSKQFNISLDFSKDINLGDFLKVSDKYSLNITTNTKVEYSELFIPNSSINYFVNSNSSDFNFSDIAPKDGYYLNFQIDGKQYYLNGETKELESGINWNAYKNNIQVCPINDSWDCEWEDSMNWNWKPNIPAYNLANISENVDLEINLPQESKISGTIQFGNSFANKQFYVIAYQIDSPIYQEQEFQADENGNLNINLKAVPMDNYRLEIFNEKVHYVLNLDGNYELIFNSNSWRNDIFGAKSTTLINMSEDLDFGTIDIPTLNTLNFNIENLDDEESVFVFIFDDENYFYNDNMETANKVNFVAKSGLYKIAVFSSKHNSGYAVNQNGENNFTKFNWNFDSALDISVGQDRNYTISFGSNKDLRAISGKVNLGSGNIENGWIEISNDEIQKGTAVAKNGKYKIEGLKPSEDYNFSLEYTSWEFDNVVLTKDVGVWTAGNLENQDISRNAYSYTITGKMEYLGDDEVKMKAMLIKYNKKKGSWKVGRKLKLDENSEFKFAKLQPNPNIIYYVCAGVKVSDSKGSHYNRFNATKGDENLSGVDMNSSIQITDFLRVSN